MCEPDIFDVISRFMYTSEIEDIIQFVTIYRSECIPFTTISFLNQDIGIQIILPPCTIGLSVSILQGGLDSYPDMVTNFYSIFPCMPFENILYPQNCIVSIPFTDFFSDTNISSYIFINVGFYLQK